MLLLALTSIYVICLIHSSEDVIVHVLETGAIMCIVTNTLCKKSINEI